MNILMSFWDRTSVTDNASATEFFIALLGILFLLIWGWGHWSARRKGVSFYNEKAPKWLVLFLKGFAWLFGILTAVCLIGALLPGDVFDVFSPLSGS